MGHAKKAQLDMFHASSAQLGLFAQPAALPVENTLPKLMAPADYENFSWWCRQGNTGMTAACLVRDYHFTPERASTLVRQLKEAAP